MMRSIDDADVRHARVGDRVSDGHGGVVTIDELPYLCGDGLVRARVHFDNGDHALGVWGPRFRIPLAIEGRTK